MKDFDDMFAALDVMRFDGEALRWGEMMLQEEFGLWPEEAKEVFAEWNESRCCELVACV